MPLRIMANDESLLRTDLMQPFIVWHIMAKSLAAVIAYLERTPDTPKSLRELLTHAAIKEKG